MKIRTAVLLSLIPFLCSAGFTRASEFTFMAEPFAKQCSDAAFTASLGVVIPRNAVELCNQALQDVFLKPGDRAAVYVDRAILFLRKRDFVSAQSDLDAAMAINPALAEIYVNLGALRVAQRRDQEAIVALNRSLELGLEQSYAAYYNRGIAREHLNDVSGAYEDYKKAEALAPDWDLPKAELKRFARQPKGNS